MTKTATIQKKARETQTMRTGAPVIRKPIWLVIDNESGRVIETAATRKLASDRARFAGYQIPN